MSITVTCPTRTCGQSWAVVPAIRKAHPGYRTPPKRVTVPLEDILGNRLGTARKDTSHWVSQGASVNLMARQAGTDAVYEWPCLCFQALEYREPAWETVPCQHGGDGCAVYHRNVMSPSDLYSNPRHGGACPCCGQQGSHLVRLDRQGDLPSCLRTGKVTAVDPFSLAANA